jgi:excisionase family DNA binding protein
MKTNGAGKVETPYMNTREAMDYLRLTSPSSIYHLINEQRLPHLRRGGRLLFDKRDIDAWLRGTDAVSMARIRGSR